VNKLSEATPSCNFHSSGKTPNKTLRIKLGRSPIVLSLLPPVKDPSHFDSMRLTSWMGSAA